MIRLITISGPRAAGKRSLRERLALCVTGFDLRVIVPHTTRRPREGEVPGLDYHFVDLLEFQRLSRTGAFAYKVGINAEHSSGTTWRELELARFGLLDITTEGALHLRSVIREKGGDAFLIYIYAPLEERRRRIRERQPRLDDAQIEKLLQEDPVSPDPNVHRQDFDSVIENPDGYLGRTVTVAQQAVEQFLQISAV